MPNTFFASDHHLGHEKILQFVHWDGTPIRAGFSCVDEMNEHMIDRHNAVVSDKDTIWFLGDVVINRRYLKLIERFNGRKRLILGNHDIFSNKDYYKAGFEDLHAFRKFDGFVATHIPVHRESLRTSWGKNVHGHLHRNRIMIPNPAYEIYWVNQETGEIRDNQVPAKIVDPDYINVCVEKLDNYTPVSIDEIRSRF